MNTLNTRVARDTSGVTRRNPHTGRRCPRYYRLGAFAPDSIVCDWCAGARPSITTATVTVTLALLGGER
jgi:hypothetical protein